MADNFLKRVGVAASQKRVTKPVLGRTNVGQRVIGNGVLPNGDLYFEGSYTKDTGPTHVKDVSGRTGSMYRTLSVTGTLSKDQVLQLVNYGCTMSAGKITVPVANLVAVQSILR